MYSVPASLYFPWHHHGVIRGLGQDGVLVDDQQFDSMDCPKPEWLSDMAMEFYCSAYPEEQNASSCFLAIQIEGENTDRSMTVHR